MTDPIFSLLFDGLTVLSLLFIITAEGSALFNGLCYPATKGLTGVSKLKAGFSVYAMRSMWAHGMIAALNKKSAQWNSDLAFAAAVVTGISSYLDENASIEGVLQSAVVAFGLVFASMGEAAKYLSFTTSVSTDALIHLMRTEAEETELT